MDLVEGKIIAEHYKLIRQLGQGSFGNVWLAHNLLADIDVAIKFYGMMDQTGLEEFREEFKIAYGLRHPNLLNINHFDIFENCPYLVLPYCERGDVGHLIGKMDEAEIWRFISDVSNGLSFLHAFRPAIIHQDIKPENILITAEGRYVITDFGISHKLRTQLSKHSRTGNIKGTVAYMGPERLSSKPKVIIASDIWSFGATLYEIMEGKLLWEGMGGIVQLKQTQPPDIEANYSEELIRLVRACLAADPSERPMASAIYNYAIAYRRHQPLPQLTQNDTARIAVTPPIVHSQNGHTNRVIEPVSRYQTNNATDGVKYSVKQKPKLVKYKPTSPNSYKIQNQWKRWLPIVAACLCAVAVLWGFYLFISSIREESQFISCKTCQDYELFLKKYPNSSYAEKARKRITELAPITPKKDFETDPKTVNDQTNNNNNIIYVSNHNGRNSSQTVNAPVDVQPIVQPDTRSEDELMYYGCFTLDDYIAYVNKFPTGKFRKEADLMINQLTGRGQTQTNINTAHPVGSSFTTTTSTSNDISVSISYTPGRGFGPGGRGPGNGGYHGGGPGGRGPGNGGYRGGGPGSRR